VSVGHYENFPVASLLLPAALREPIAVIYRFARSADDLADEGSHAPEARLRELQAYRDELARIEANKPPETPLFRDVARLVHERAVPLAPFRDLLDAFSQDVVKKRYADFAELLEYCRRSANPVGRLLLSLFRKDSLENLRRSDAICTSLQLINFWQDVALDWAKGRVYLPQDEMARFGVSEAHLSRGTCDRAWQGLLAFQCSRTRELMLQGMPLLTALSGRVFVEIAMTIQGGLRILEKTAAAGYDVFRRRPVLRWYDWPVLVWRIR
jgi:phytoene synthase